MSTAILASTNKSIAVWCAKKHGSADSEFEAHFNYWRIAGDEEFLRRVPKARDFLEIGVLLDEPGTVEHVCIFLPDVIAPDKISDCSGHFRKTSIAQGIFNEVLAVLEPTEPGTRFVELSKASGIFCRVHCFMMDGEEIDSSELALKSLAGGTLLTITASAIKKAAAKSDVPPAYFRLRFYIEPQNAFLRAIPIHDRHFLSGFDELEYIDFRLNEARTLPDQIETQMRNDRGNLDIKMRLVAFLTAVPVQSAVSDASIQFYKLRLLEHHLWSPYVPTGLPEGMTVHHWKRAVDKDPTKRQDIKDFSAFVKLQTRRSGRRILWRYILIAFAFGVLGNLSASAIEAGFRCVWPTIVSSFAVKANVEGQK